MVRPRALSLFLHREAICSLCSGDSRLEHFEHALRTVLQRHQNGTPRVDLLVEVALSDPSKVLTEPVGIGTLAQFLSIST